MLNAPGSTARAANTPTVNPPAVWAPRRVAPPSGFGWTPSFQILEVAPGRFTTTLNPSSLRVSTSITRYANLARPDNSGNGLSWAAADKALWAAVNAVFSDNAATTIYVLGSGDPAAPTLYDWDNGFAAGAVVNPIEVIAVSDTSTLAKGYVLASVGMGEGGSHLGTWALTADGAGPHVYEATLAAAPGGVVDGALQTAAGPSSLTLRSSIATVEANPGSYWHDSGKLYVRTTDSRDPDASVRPLRVAVNHRLAAAVNAYYEGLTFESGQGRAFYAQNGSTITCVDCDFTRGQGQGFELNVGAGVTNATITVYLIRCKFRGNAGDGAGYTILGAGMTVNAVEIDCTYVGNSGAGTDQGGSAHFTAGNTAIRVIRINPRCSGNKTQGFADVGGCKIWILGGSVTGEGSGIYCGDTGTTWVQGTTLTGNTTDLVTDNAGGTINTSGAIYKTTSGAGTVQRYQP